MSIRTPLAQHERNHRKPELTLSECWECGRERAHCRSKRRYADAQVAAATALEIGIRTEWQTVLAPYPCPWCCAYHLTTAKPGSVRWKRAEKRRRRWAAEQETERRTGVNA